MSSEAGKNDANRICSIDYAIHIIKKKKILDILG